MNRVLVLSAIIAFTGIVSAYPAASNADAAAPIVTSTLKNGGFEGPYAPVNSRPNSKAVVSGVMAPSWLDNSGWADVTVSYVEETKDVHEGKSALKVSVATVHSGSSQILQLVGTATAGHSYTLSVWIKGDGLAPVDVYLRMAGPPYTEIAKRTVTPSATWQKVTVTATCPVTAGVGFMIRASAPTTYCVDDASYTDNGLAK